MSGEISEVHVDDATVPSSTETDTGARDCPSVVAQPTTGVCEECGMVFGSDRGLSLLPALSILRADPQETCGQKTGLGRR